jgi:hypothetical protein
MSPSTRAVAFARLTQGDLWLNLALHQTYGVRVDLTCLSPLNPAQLCLKRRACERGRVSPAHAMRSVTQAVAHCIRAEVASVGLSDAPMSKIGQ